MILLRFFYAAATTLNLVTAAVNPLRPREDSVCEPAKCVAQAVKDADATLHSCAQAVAEDELNPLEDIKCPFSAGEALKKIPECVSCKLIGRCAVDNSAPGTSPTVRHSSTCPFIEYLYY